MEGIAPLVAAGLALHYLHPRSKRPIGDDWQNKPTHTLAHLLAEYRQGYNLGVRLGEPSAVVGGYLHAFDIDIRVPELADEAWAALVDLLPGIDLDALPCVASGSRGESRHLYFISEQAFRSKRLVVSEGKHRDSAGKWHLDWEVELFGSGKQVALPPSIHPDTGKPYLWERPFDLDGADMGIPITPIISAALLSELTEAFTADYAYEAVEPLTFKAGQLESELEDIDVSDLHYDDWIRLGQALHHQFGGSQVGFDLWLQHTNRSTKFTGEAQVREMRRSKWPSFGRYRGRPVTMATVRLWVLEARRERILSQFGDVEGDFQSAFDEAETPANADADDDFLSPSPSPSPAAVGTTDITDDDLLGAPAPVDEIDALGTPGNETAKPLEWVSLLHTSEEGVVKSTLHNLRLIVENDTWTAGVPAFNEFIQEVVQRGTPGIKAPRRSSQPKPPLQLVGASWQLHDKVNGDFWTEDKDNAIRALIEAPTTQGGYGIKVPDRDLRAAIDIVARKNGFHPVREYLNDLAWDGKSRVDRLFIDYLGAPDDPYHRAVSRLMLVAAVTRVFEPGHKFDTAIVLEGVQGKRKSTFIEILAKNWFVEIDVDVTDTQAVVELLQGAWLAELNELGGINKADVRNVKAFISRKSDKVRLAYAKRAQEYHRQSVLCGSTNDDVYLRDQTGGRRFLPVKCVIPGEIDTNRLLLEVDQLWAEALTIYQQMRVEQPYGTLPLYLTNADAKQIAEQLQESRKVESSEDALAGRIAEWLDTPINDGGFDDNVDGSQRYRDKVCLIEVWCECLKREESQYTGAFPATVGRAMRMVPGWVDTGKRDRFGKYGQQRGFYRKSPRAPLLP